MNDYMTVYELMASLAETETKIRKAAKHCAVKMKGRVKTYRKAEVKAYIDKHIPVAGELPEGMVTKSMIVSAWKIQYAKLKQLFDDGMFPEPEGVFVSPSRHRIEYWTVEQVNDALAGKRPKAKLKTKDQLSLHIQFLSGKLDGETRKQQHAFKRMVSRTVGANMPRMKITASDGWGLHEI